MTAADRDILRAMVRDAVREAVAELRAGTPRVPAAPTVASAAGPTGEAHAGLVSEKIVAALPAGATLRLAPAAVVTPLARDRARSRGVKLERIR